MKRKRRLRKRLILPPVFLAAIFVYLLYGQFLYGRSGEEVMKAAAPEVEIYRGSEDAGDFDTSFSEETRVLKIDTETGQQSEKGDPDVQTSAETGEKQDAVQLLFAGDIYLSDHVLNAYEKAGGIEGVLSGELREEIKKTDLFMANEEFPFSDRGSAADDKQFTFRLPTARIKVMQEIGPDIVTLANNHILDYGEDALLDTCMTLDQAGIKRVGAGAGLEEAKRLEVSEIKGKKIGFLAASRVIPVSSWTAGASHPGVFTTYDPGPLLSEIKKAEEQCDYLVVYVHWGIEKNTEPEEYQKNLARQYIDAGADLVVGSHPHVLQGIEYYKGKPILYSMGNFVFGSVIPETMMARVEISAEGEVELAVLPAVSSAGYTRKMDSAKWPEFFRNLEEMSFGVTVDEDGTIRPDMPPIS